MKKNLLRIAFAITALGITACATEDQSAKSRDQNHSSPNIFPSSAAVRIQYAMQPGTSWMTKSVEKTTMTANPGTKNAVKTSLEVSMNRKFNLISIDKENAMNLRVRYMDVRVKFKDDNESWVYDSNDPHSRKNALGYESLPGNTLEVRLNPATGQVLNVRGGETIYRILGRDDLAGEANSIFLDRFNQELYIYADGPLDIGQQWTRTFNVAAPYGLQYVHTFTLEKHKKKQGFLKRESQISTGMMPGNLYADNRKFSLTGTQTAELNVDLESGIIYGLVAHTELKGQQKMPAGPGRENPVKTPIQVKIDLISEMSMK